MTGLVYVSRRDLHPFWDESLDPCKLYVQPLPLLRKDRQHLAPNLGFHGFLVPLSAASTLPDNKPMNLPMSHT